MYIRTTNIEKYLSFMRVAVLPSWTYNKKTPVAGIYMYQQAKALSDFHDVEFLYLKWSLLNKTSMSIDGNLKIVKRSNFWFPKRNMFFLSLWVEKYFLLFKERHKVSPFDIIHAHDALAGYAAYIFSLRTRVPFVITVHNTQFLDDQIPKWREEYISLMLNNANCVIAVGKMLYGKLMIKYKLENVRQLPNFIDGTVFKPHSIAKNSHFTFISVGSLHPNKGFDILLEAFNLLSKQYPKISFKLIVIGDGNERRRLESFIKLHDLKKSVLMSGWMKNIELPQILNHAHVFISSSRVETFGISPLEALACGLPVITTISGGPEQFINIQNGLLVEKENVLSLKDAMVCLYDNYKKYSADDISKNILKLYDKKTIAPLLSDLLIEKSIENNNLP
jgi:L-malate glycosyltransferase